MRSEDRSRGFSERRGEQLSRFRGNSFTISMPQGWQDKTMYTFIGPVDDGVQHNVVINVEYDVEVDSVTSFAEAQIEMLQAQLQGCRILKQGETSLSNGREAYEVIFRWEPTDAKRIYQWQIYVLSGSTAYTLTTVFSKKTRKTRGPEVSRIMKSFSPEQVSGGRENIGTR